MNTSPTAPPLRYLQERFQTEGTLCDFAPTLAALWGLPPPNAAQGVPLTRILQAAAERLPAKATLQRTLIFCPDAIGDIIHQAYPAYFSELQQLADVKTSCTAVMPSVTPVCFGSIFTGAIPAVHGIQEYAKPVIKIETLHDVFCNAGLRVASIAVNNCSIDKIFRDRAITYISARSNAEAFDFTTALIERDAYDVIISYDGGYDSSIHKHGCRAPESLANLRLALQRYADLVALTDTHWQSYHRLVTFTPDHGCHDIPETGLGKHGSDSFDDIVLNHYYRFRSGS